MLLRSTVSLGGGWYPTVPTLVAAPNKTFLIKQIIKMPMGTYLLPVGNATGTGGYLRVLGNKEGTGKFEFITLLFSVAMMRLQLSMGISVLLLALIHLYQAQQTQWM